MERLQNIYIKKLSRRILAAKELGAIVAASGEFPVAAIVDLALHCRKNQEAALQIWCNNQGK